MSSPASFSNTRFDGGPAHTAGIFVVRARAAIDVPIAELGADRRKSPVKHGNSACGHAAASANSHVRVRKGTSPKVARENDARTRMQIKSNNFRAEWIIVPRGDSFASYAGSRIRVAKSKPSARTPWSTCR